MNKKLLPIIVVVLLLLLGGWYFMSKKTPGNTYVPATGGNQPASAATSLKDLITKGVAQTCTFSGDKSQGMVYLSSGKVRGDFDTTVDSKTTKSHMLVMDNTSYIWMDGQKSGFKMSFDSNATPPASAGSASAPSGSFDTNASMNYKCSLGVSDAGLFTLPAGVTFSSFALPSQAAPSGSSSGSSSSSQCSYCNALSGDDKTQCLKALNCK